jgi:hypothetical protein
MNKISKFFLALIILVVAFTLGYKMGDANGYSDGYKVGYLYDCKSEIGLINDQVQAQSKALVYTDSALKRILRENDSLKRKEYYQKRYNDSISLVNQFSTDSSKYYRVARQYNDSVIAAIGSYPTNFILENGTVNKTLCMFAGEFKRLAECRSDFDLRSRLENKLKKKKGRKKK